MIAHPGNNSLPAALEVLARLQQDGALGRIFYLDGPDDDAGLEEITDTVHDLDVRRALQQARIVLVLGHHLDRLQRWPGCHPSLEGIAMISS